MVRNGIRAAARMFKWPPPFIDSSSSTSHQEGGMGKRGVQLRTAWRTRYALEYTSVYIDRLFMKIKFFDWQKNDPRKK
jgi:hypothetical protein